MSQASSARACGIDFGTSNSTVGWLRPDQPTLLLLEDGRPTLPSVVFFNAEEDTVSFGRAGLREYLDGYEGRLMRSLKSLLGSSLIDGRTDVQGRVVAFRELLTRFIADLKGRAEGQARGAASSRRCSDGRCSSSMTIPRPTASPKTRWRKSPAASASGNELQYERSRRFTTNRLGRKVGWCDMARTSISNAASRTGSANWPMWQGVNGAIQA